MRRAPAKYVTLVTQMRCPSCGTENAPGSRFCGGCGAKLAISRVAPTQKISDDASFPQTRPPPVTVPGVAPAPPPYAPMGPAAMQPMAASTAQRSASAPRASISSQPPAPQRSLGSQPPAPRANPTPPPGRPITAPVPVRIDEPSLSLPTVARRPWGLILFVLLIDVGLAIAGGWMLSAGLSTPSPAEHKAP